MNYYSNNNNTIKNFLFWIHLAGVYSVSKYTHTLIYFGDARDLSLNSSCFYLIRIGK